MPAWKRVKDTGSDAAHYGASELTDARSGMAVLREMFPTAQADSMNFVLFSTSGTHGTYRTIEDEEKEPGYGVTFLVVHPRIVALKYGTVFPETAEDFKFLKTLRARSLAAVSHIGTV